MWHATASMFPFLQHHEALDAVMLLQETFPACDICSAVEGVQMFQKEAAGPAAADSCPMLAALQKALAHHQAAEFLLICCVGKSSGVPPVAAIAGICLHCSNVCCQAWLCTVADSTQHVVTAIRSLCSVQGSAWRGRGKRRIEAQSKLFRAVESDAFDGRRPQVCCEYTTSTSAF